MTAIAAAVLLWAGVAAEALALLGLWRLKRPLDQLHFLGLSGVLGAALIAAAVAVRFQSLQLALKAIAIALVLGLGGTVMTRVLARAIRAREAGSVGPEAPDVLPLRRDA